MTEKKLVIQFEHLTEDEEIEIVPEGSDQSGRILWQISSTVTWSELIAVAHAVARWEQKQLGQELTAIEVAEAARLPLTVTAHGSGVE